MWDIALCNEKLKESIWRAAITQRTWPLRSHLVDSDILFSCKSKEIYTVEFPRTILYSELLRICDNQAL